jgi:hypothetical protein
MSQIEDELLRLIYTSLDCRHFDKELFLKQLKANIQGCPLRYGAICPQYKETGFKYSDEETSCMNCHYLSDDEESHDKCLQGHDFKQYKLLREQYLRAEGRLDKQ